MTDSLKVAAGRMGGHFCGQWAWCMDHDPLRGSDRLNNSDSHARRIDDEIPRDVGSQASLFVTSCFQPAVGEVGGASRVPDALSKWRGAWLHQVLSGSQP